jgi:hypothetical protein
MRYPVVAVVLCISALAPGDGLAQEPQRDRPPSGFALDQHAAEERELQALQQQDKRRAERDREDERRRACYAAWERATFDGGARPTCRLTPSQAKTLDRRSAGHLSSACLDAIDTYIFGKGPVPAAGCIPTPKLSAKYAAARDRYRERMAAYEARSRQIDAVQEFISQMPPIAQPAPLPAPAYDPPAEPSPPTWTQPSPQQQRYEMQQGGQRCETDCF